MKNYCKTIGALAAASALVAGNASAEVEYELHTGYTNQYIFRGVDFGNDLVEVGADVSTEWNGIGLSAGAWYATYDLAGLDSDNATELDLYAEASKDFGFLTAAVGYIWYFNDDNNFIQLQDYQELYFAVSRDFGFAEASLTYFWDIEGDNDGYSELALSRSFELNSCLALNVSSNIGFAVEEGEFTSWTTKVALDWGFAERAKLSPFVAVSVGLSDDDSLYQSDNDNELVGGSMLSVSF